MWIRANVGDTNKSRQAVPGIFHNDTCSFLLDLYARKRCLAASEMQTRDFNISS